MRKVNSNSRDAIESTGVEVLKVRERLDLLGHIEKIVSITTDSSLSDATFEKAKPSITFVSRVMGLTKMQVVLFAHFVDQSDDQSIRSRDLARALKCKTLRVLRQMNDIDELERRRLIRCCRERRSITYRVPLEVIMSLKEGKNYVPTNRRNLSIKDFFTEIEEVFSQRQEENELTYESLCSELDELLDGNRELRFVQELRNYDLRQSERILLILFCHLFVNNNDDNVGIHDLERLYEGKYQLRAVARQLGDGKHILQEFGLVENQFEDGFVNKEAFKLTEKAKERLLVELDIKARAMPKKDMISYESLAAKTLFYNPIESRQVNELTRLLSGDNFASVQKRLLDSGMRTGFACLFYGAPGTGKTETVYQLARATKRDIIQVDIASTKSMWFGESEKKIKEIFDRYRNNVTNSNVAPILFFNEADAVIGKRMENASRSVDQTCNAIQNIILQELETLNGILIATTNLTQNLDKAFERRFLYKIEFKKPSLESKSSIWMSMLPSLSQAEATELATQYDFSGGQIENIIRKRMVDTIISGSECTLDQMHAYCRTELLNKNDNRNPIGFLKP